MAAAARLLALLCVLVVAAPCHGAFGGKKAGVGGGLTRTPSSVTVLGKLRMAMLEWYCVETTTHMEERPCQNHAFMVKMRQADTPEKRKLLVAERSKSMPTDDEGRRALAQQSRAGYVSMYKAYCEQETPKNPDVCSNDSLRKMYQAFERSPGKSAMPL
eukprot:CAMPEP_0183355140 /NCGR_PEP_ID=MMETSP0164_2-20130417/39327_1 /TAXON_ID=221442 /ORGANISM="Coccolithus pelagicus ssp braarudi, Strain PLY182g" /LENGTH=158 /DNA_ID=CAMNT_0025528163 /DNA_START=21 /DNA_END=497 /DNA_ORIENTATION=+